MDQAQIASCHQQLLAMRANLLAQIAAQRGGVVGRAESASAHFGQPDDSHAQLATEREIEFALGERETEELVAIDAALGRITGGNYGQCTDCGISVPVARLKASPEAGRCIPCQEKAEQGMAA